MPNDSSPSDTSQVRVRRVLTLWNLIFYGLVLIQPTASIPLFGVAQKLSNGHTVTTILVAMQVTMITASSYGRIPAFTLPPGPLLPMRVRQSTYIWASSMGRAMLLDYILQPLLSTVVSRSHSDSQSGST